MKKVKYIRTSTKEQNNERQKLNKEDFSKIYVDQCSGTINLGDRPQGKNLLKDVYNNKIDVVHVLSIDRLGRSIIGILQVINILNNNKVNLYVENIGMYSMINDKPNPSFKLIISVLGNVAEMEREMLLERQKIGIEIGKLKNVYKGRLHGTKISDEDFLKKYTKVVKELRNGESLRRAAAIGGVSLGTVQKVKRVMNKEVIS